MYDDVHFNKVYIIINNIWHFVLASYILFCQEHIYDLYICKVILSTKQSTKFMIEKQRSIYIIQIIHITKQSKSKLKRID
jgi:hypothetical protein